IYIADERLATVENDGHGGCNLYRYAHAEARDLFHSAVSQWVTSDERVLEAEDLLVGALLDQYIVIQEANRLRRAGPSLGTHASRATLEDAAGTREQLPTVVPVV